MKIEFLTFFRSMAFRISCYVALAVSVVMILALGLINHFAEIGLQKEAIEKTEGSLRTIVGNISQILEQAETCARNYDYMILDYYDNKQSELNRIPHCMVENNEWLEGATLAFNPNKIKGYGLFAPFSYQDSKYTVHDTLLEYDYTEYDWFRLVQESGKDNWGEPFRMSGTHVMISVFSHPVKRKGSDKVEAVCCADVSLDRLKGMINENLPFKGCTAFVISKAGNYIVHPNNKYVLTKNISNQSIFESGLTDDLSDSVTKQLQSGTKGHLDLKLTDAQKNGFTDDKYSIYYYPIEKTGWSLAIVCPHSAVFGGVENMLSSLRKFFLVCIVILLLITTLLIMQALRPLRRFTAAAEDVAHGNYQTALPVIKSHDELYHFREAFVSMQSSLVENIKELTRTVSEQSRIENELNIARDIQQNLLSKAFSPYIDWPNLELYALLESAREVGGDLYDFFIRDRKLFFCVGDVSGKGVPAALFMAVTRGLFRVIAHSEDSPATIITQINHTLAADNPQNMFVTMLCGCLNLDNGHLTLANAGHNPPIRIEGEKAQYVNILPSVPLGFFEDSRYHESELTLLKDETFIVYTDGVTEAENTEKELYGEERLIQFVEKSRGKSAQEMIVSVREDVRNFSAGAEQSDDLTMFCMCRTGDEVASEYMKYLDFSNHLEEVEKLNPFLLKVQADLNIDKMLMMQLNLAIEEALVNVINYAYPVGEEGLIKLTVEAPTGGHSLRFILTDYGVAFDPTSAKKADVQADAMDRPIGGLGIFLVKNIMTSVEYTRRNQSNILLMIKILD